MSGAQIAIADVNDTRDDVDGSCRSWRAPLIDGGLMYR